MLLLNQIKNFEGDLAGDTGKLREIATKMAKKMKSYKKTY